MDDDSPMMNIHWMEGVVYPVTILGLLVLSTMWFLMIDKGVRKQQAAYYAAQEAQSSLSKKKTT